MGDIIDTNSIVENADNADDVGKIENVENTETVDQPASEVDGTKMSKARRKVLADNMREGLESAGFHKVDPKVIDIKPPTIKWGELYKEFKDEEKVDYLEKLASTMNHAAFLIQGERDQLIELCELKEQQIGKLSDAMSGNNGMIQSEIIKINEERQLFNQHVANLNKYVKSLKEQIVDLGGTPEELED